MAHGRTMGVPVGAAKVADTFPEICRARLPRQGRQKNGGQFFSVPAIGWGGIVEAAGRPVCRERTVADWSTMRSRAESGPRRSRCPGGKLVGRGDVGILRWLPKQSDCTNKAPVKLKTIDDVCGKPAGSFQRSLKEMTAYLKAQEQERKARIQAARVPTQWMAWAA